VSGAALPRPRFVPDAALAAIAGPTDQCLVVAGRTLLVRAAGDFPRVADLPPETEWIPLGRLDGARVWAAALPTADEALGEWRGWPALASVLDQPLAALAGRALQVVTWRRAHRYCGACRAELSDVPGEHARRCPDCDLYVPMQLSPAVLVAIRRPGRSGGADEILLVRHAVGLTDLWALVAGEEVSLPLTELAYFGSQPWAMSGPGVVLAGFTATCADPAAEPVVDGQELAQARWFALDALPAELPPAYSISRWLIDAVAAERARL
jgi:NAD+ diphosphatase